jgi:hypothetical protein
MTIYRERSAGTWRYFTYSDGNTINLAESWVNREMKRRPRHTRLVTA